MNDLFLQQLTDEQKEVVISTDDILLTAIPGSGKTRVLTNKIIHKLSSCTEFDKIIAITYTRRAAEEMRSRIVSMLVEFPENIWIGTIHKFCLDYIIRRFRGFSTALAKGFQVLGDQDMEDYRDEIAGQFGFRSYDIEWGIKKDGSPKTDNIDHRNVVAKYYNLLRNNKLLDFDLILHEAYTLLNENECIRKNLYSQITSIFIDEYQDTHERQYDILSSITTTNNDMKIQLLFVGDTNQAIYTGIGGIAKNMNEIQAIFKRPIIERHLSYCFRSHQDVINFYKSFAVDDYQMISRANTYNAPICSINYQIHKDHLLDYIKSIIEELIKIGYKESDICIVAPQWFLLYSISNGLRKMMPETNFDSPAIIPLKRDEDNVLYKLSKIFLSTMSGTNISILRYIAGEVIRQLKMETAIDYSQFQQDDILNIANSIKKDTNSIKEGTLFLREVLIKFFDKIDAIDTYETKIDDFIEGTKKRISRYEEQGLEDDKLFFEKSLRSGEGIVVTTAHSIKGEEYKAIISYGMLRGFIPHWKDIFTRSDIECDHIARRLLFVVASRAKERVYFIAERGRKTSTGNDLLPTPIIVNKRY